MMKEKLLNEEELERVSGGTSFSTIDGLVFNYNIGAKVRFFDKEVGDCNTIVKKQGYLSMLGRYWPYLYLEIEDNRRPNGWYVDKISGELVGLDSQYLAYMTIVAG